MDREQARAAHQRDIVNCSERVARLEAQLREAYAARDGAVRKSHGPASEGKFSYMEIERLTDPETNGGLRTQKISRSRAIQICRTKED